METEEVLSGLAAYYRFTKPNREYLAEYLARLPRYRIEAAIKNEERTDSLGLDLDAIFVSEAIDFLSMSILNFLAYKQLMGSGYRSWGWVTLYYSNFYAASCLLRLSGTAAIHLEWLKLDDLSMGANSKRPDNMRILVERVQGSHAYMLKKPTISELSWTPEIRQVAKRESRS